MKRSIAVIVISAFLVCIAAAGLSAQSTTPAQDKLPGASKDLYVKTLYIMSIYPHSLGYRVDYLTSSGQLNTCYVPLPWFSGTAGKAEIVSENGPSIPYMEIVFDAGKFKLVRLHVAPGYSGKGWKGLSNGMNIDDKFKVDTLEIIY